MRSFNMRAYIFASEWIFGLFASVIPCEHMGSFFDHFYEQKWLFFYSLVLTLLKRHESEIRSEEDLYNLLRSIKVSPQESSKNSPDNSFVNNESGLLRTFDADVDKTNFLEQEDSFEAFDNI